MKKVSNNKVIRLLAVFLLLVMATSGCKEKITANDITYTCPMHPDIIKNEASTCPICGMDLVRLHPHGIDNNEKDSLNLTKTLKNGINANVKTISPNVGILKDTVILKGIIAINTNYTKTISSYISGRIERLHVKYNFQKVAKGQKIMDIYSPDLVAAQQELLYLKQAGDTHLMQQAKRKLQLLGVSERDINQILSSGKANYSISIYSSSNGYIIDGLSNAGEVSLNATNSPLNLREGMYVKAGDIFFKVYDNSSVWAEFYASNEESKSLKQNEKILIDIGNEKIINARISSIQPFYKDGQNFTNVRVRLDNSKNGFKVGQLINAKITVENNEGLWIPRSAVYQSGSRNIVFVKSGNLLHPKQVAVTNKFGNKVLVLSGINKNDRIAENAAHLVDPEAFISNTNENE